MPFEVFLDGRQYFISRCNLIPCWPSRVVLESQPRTAEGSLVPLDIIQSLKTDLHVAV